MKSWTQKNPVWAVVAMAASLIVAQALAVEVKAPAVTDQDKLQFTQQNAQAQMQELQDRMFHLAEITKQSEPDDATRLLLAVRKSREQLIIEKMKDVLDQAKTSDFGGVAIGSKEVLIRLDALKRLLVAADLDLQLQLERLKKLQAAIKQLDVAIKEENNQQNKSKQLEAALKQDGAPKPQELQQAKANEETNQKKVDQVNQISKDLGKLEKAVDALSTASQSQSQAQGHLGNAKPGFALTQQGEATKNMEVAKAELEQERQKVLADLQKQVKQAVVENLTDMLDRQVAVRQASENLFPKAEASREAMMRYKGLSPSEERIATICQQTMDLVEQTEFSVALPPALESLERRMLLVTADLEAGHAGQPVVDAEVSLERDIKDLIETFRTMDNGDGQCDCKGTKGNKNKLLAELKVIRMLQLRVNSDTLAADTKRPQVVAELSPDLREKIGKVRDAEAAARDAMERVHQNYGQ